MAVQTIIVFGVTGDLSVRLLLPAVYELIKKKKKLLIIGVADQKTTAIEILSHARAYIKELHQVTFDELVRSFFYYQCDIASSDTYAQLSQFVDQCEHIFGCDQQRVVYCATPSDLFCSIVKNSVHARLICSKNILHRVVFEKPLGWDVVSARAINDGITAFLSAEQIYYIDHYLTRELVNNILVLRSANAIFEPLWNNNYIHRIVVTLNESASIEHRGKYYDRYGALKDVMQNHLLQLAALITMEKPENLDSATLHAYKTKILQNMRVVQAVIGQYDGYLDEQDVHAHSTTETFAALKIVIDTSIWQKVPVYLVTGKCLTRKETEINIFFKEQHACLFNSNQLCMPNVLTIRIFPDEGFVLTVNAKKPGINDETVRVPLEFCYTCLFGPYTPQAYELLLDKVLRGDRSSTVSFNEIEYQWNIIDEVKRMQLPLHTYKKGSLGPVAAYDMMKDHI
ncbi:MAG: glucose-6-phosphate dehydrogenase [Candidatus Babeliaceae bacterium]